MTDLETLKTAIAKLEPGGWSLTVNGFARRALKIKPELTRRQVNELSELMDQTGLTRREIHYGGSRFDVWDHQA